MAHRTSIACCLALSIAGLGCTKKDADEVEASSNAETPNTPEESKDASGAAAGVVSAEGIGTQAAAVIRDATSEAAAAPVLEHDHVLGHIMMGNAVASANEVKAQAAPPSVQNMVDLEVLKSLIAMQLGGSRGTAIVNIDLTQPLGCAWLDSDVVEAPIVCVVGYKGGAEGLVKDLGDEGQVADAGGHLAAYTVEGETLYVDELGGQVAVSTHSELLKLGRGYLETNIIGRADKAIADVEFAVFPKAAKERYADEFKDFVSLFDEPATSEDLERQLEDTEQFLFGFGFTPKGATLVGSVHTTPGSDSAEMIDRAYGGRMDQAFVSKLPMSTFAFAGMQVGDMVLEGPRWERSLDLASTMVTSQWGGDAEALKTEFAAFAREQSELYGRDMALGAIYEPGTLGGLILEVGKKSPGREAWKAWSARFTPDAVLPKQVREDVGWTFAPGATTVEGIEIDRWSIELRGKVAASFDKEPDLEHIRLLWTDRTIHVDRAELDDRVVFVVAPKGSDTFMASAIRAAAGGKTIRDHKGWSEIAAAGKGAAGIYAVDVARAVEWLRPLVPPAEVGKIPSPLGNDLSDVTITIRHPAPGAATGSLDVSQALIDQLKLIADR